MEDATGSAETPGGDRDDWDQHWESFGQASEGAPASRYRQRIVCKLLGSLARGTKILDIGSGQGELALFLAQQFPETDVWGIEYSEKGVQRAGQLAESQNRSVRFSQRDLLVTTDLPPDQAGWADVAVCSEVLEHVDEPEKLLRNASEYLGPDCMLIVTVPGGPRSAFDRHIGHRQHFTPETLRHLLESSGYLVQQTVRAGFPFFNLYRLAVIAMGTRLIDDLRHEGSEGNDRDSRLTRIAYAGFDVLFRLNLASTAFGWQIVAVARPSSTSARARPDAPA